MCTLLNEARAQLAPLLLPFEEKNEKKKRGRKKLFKIRVGHPKT